MSVLLVILFNAIFVQNVVLTQFLGICSFLGVSTQTSSAKGMGLAVIAVMCGATAITWPIEQFILIPLGLGYLRIVLFALVIACLVQMAEAIIKKTSPSLYDSLGIYLPLITTNCAILGVAITNVDVHYGFVASIVNAAGTGIGFLLAIVLFSVIRAHIERAPVPYQLQGLPIALIAGAIMALAFVGFSGVAEGLFGA